MNCKKVEELLPLYVGRDLDEENARLVTTHVQVCPLCARSVKEYGEANQLLQLFEPPQFSEATYTAVRSHVLSEIERRSSAPGLLESIARPFQPRLMWAVSTAVLIAVCVFVYYFASNRMNGPQPGRQLAEKSGSGEQKMPDEQEKPASPPDLPAPSGKDLKPALTVTAGGPPALPANPRKSRFNQTARHPQKARESGIPNWLPSRGPRPAVPVTTAQSSANGESKGSPNNSVTSEKTLRLEIQTKDPNIRIIWFSHPSTNQGSPNESSKGI